MKNILLIFCLLIASSNYGQRFTVAELNEIYANKEYAVITEKYKKVTGNLSRFELSKVGDAHFNIANYKEASMYYHKLFDFHSDNPPHYYFKYAQVLKANDEYELSDIMMDKYKDLSGSNYKKISAYKHLIERRAGAYSVNILPINSKYSDFASSIYKNNLIVASSTDTDEIIHKMNNQVFLDLYEVPLESNATIAKSGVKIRGNVNSNYHESNAVYTKDGNTMYFTRSHFVKKGMLKKNNKEIKLAIYKAKLKNGKWKVQGELSFSNENYSTGHPTIDKNEEYMYFSSDMPGGFGESDLYKVKMFADGTFGKPVNLGKGINTPGKEAFPFVSQNNILFFSSNHHMGIGGLDVFAVDLSNDKNIEIINLAPPLNSVKDDFGYIENKEETKGFFSSNREGGIGDDDVYQFTLLEPLFKDCQINFNGFVTNESNRKKLIGAKVVLTDTVTKMKETFITSDTSGFEKQLYCSQNTVINVSKEGFESKEIFVSFDKDVLGYEIPLKETPVEFVQNEAGDKIIFINPIYFDYGSSDIRSDAALELDKVVRIMNKYPEINIVGTSHTDSRGSAASNLRLSQRRAKSTVGYIISKGISSDRIRAKGYGESRLTNSCISGIKCSEEKHQNNRRSEFVVSEKLPQFDNSKSKDLKGSKILIKTDTDGEVKEDVTSKNLDEKYYEVKKGDTLYSVARKFKTSVNVIKEINGLKDNTISVGQKLLTR